MKPIEPGTLFEAPLPNGKYAYGYVTYDDQFVLMNIYDYLSDKSGDFDSAIGNPILLRDVLEERSRFMRLKFNIENGFLWHIKRNRKAPDALPPKYDFVAGSMNVSNIYTHEVIRPITREDIIKYPTWRMPTSEFIPLYIQGKFEEKVVVLVERVKKDGVVIEEARFELRDPDDLGGHEIYEFHSLADA